MKTRKSLATLAVGVLSTSALSMTLLNVGAAAASDSKCLIEVGSYLIRLETDSNFVGRGVLSFQKDGTLTANNSNEGGGANFAPFTTKLGTWECKGNQITARAIDFTLLPNREDQQIGRVDYTATVTGRRIQGSVDVRFYPLTEDPQASNAPLSFTNTFTGRLIRAK